MVEGQGIIVEASCDHLNQEHSVAGFGGQTGPIRVEFLVKDQSEIKVGTKGICLVSKGRGCTHGCTDVKLTHRSDVMAIDYFMNNVSVTPDPVVEPKI